MSRDTMGQSLVFFLVGATVGAAVALLYAPQDGETTRKLIGDKAVEVKGKATEFSNTVSTNAKDKWGMASEKIQGIIQRVAPDNEAVVPERIGSNGAG